MLRAHALRIGALLVCSLATADAMAAAPRFTLSAEIRPLSASDDGRFNIAAEVRATPQSTSADGRYTMKSVKVPQAACDPLLELFANGFEGT